MDMRYEIKKILLVIMYEIKIKVIRYEIKKILLVIFTGYDSSTKRSWSRPKNTSWRNNHDFKINIITHDHIYFIWENVCFH